MVHAPSHCNPESFFAQQSALGFSEFHAKWRPRQRRRPWPLWSTAQDFFITMGTAATAATPAMVTSRMVTKSLLPMKSRASGFWTSINIKSHVNVPQQEVKVSVWSHATQNRPHPNAGSNTCRRELSVPFCTNFRPPPANRRWRHSYKGLVQHHGTIWPWGLAPATWNLVAPGGIRNTGSPKRSEAFPQRCRLGLLSWEKKKTPTLLGDLGVFDKLEVKHWQYQMSVPPWVNPSSFRMLAVDCPDAAQSDRSSLRATSMGHRSGDHFHYPLVMSK